MQYSTPTDGFRLAFEQLVPEMLAQRLLVDLELLGAVSLSEAESRSVLDERALVCPIPKSAAPQVAIVALQFGEIHIPPFMAWPRCDKARCHYGLQLRWNDALTALVVGSFKCVF